MSSREWKATQWGKIASLEYGKGLRSYKDNNGNVPVYGTNGQIGSTNQTLCNTDGVIIGRKGAYRGVHYSPKPFFVIDTAFYLKAKNQEEYCNRWAYYQLMTIDINSMDSGSAIPSTSRPDFYALPVYLPPLSEQKTIAATFSCLDDMIELNNRTNQVLEKMAQAIFKHWFVDFEFPNEDGQPYKSSGGEMVDSEMGEIPKGWRVGQINDIVKVTDYVANGSFSALKENVHYIEENTGYAVLVRLVDYNKQFNGPFVWVNRTGYNFLKKSKLFGGEIIISNVGANAGKVFKAPKLGNPMTLGPNSIMLLINKFNNYLYYYLKGPLGQEKLNSIKTGSAQPKFNKTDFRNIKLVLPSHLWMDKFNTLLDPIIQNIEQIDKENKNLISLRDNLLPKLMSGEIRVPIEEVV